MLYIRGRCLSVECCICADLCCMCADLLIAVKRVVYQGKLSQYSVVFVSIAVKSVVYQGKLSQCIVLCLC